ncbi:hypothetical protein DFH28DRAFT_899768 [Melampsora americana]|nr:hypothetical protein DFH28DRAFT_899768 [Melampsora americana]
MLHSNQSCQILSGCPVFKPSKATSSSITSTYKRCLCTSSMKLRTRFKSRRTTNLDQDHLKVFRKLSTSSRWFQIDHYATLGIERTASSRQIKEKFYELSKKYHPDLNPQNERATTLFKEFVQAYSILSDPISRANHDASLNPLRSQTYDPQFDPNLNPNTNSVRRAQAHYAWNARPHQARPSPFPSSFIDPQQVKNEVDERREFEVRMARFARLANRKTQTFHPPLHSSHRSSIYSNFEPNEDRLRYEVSGLEPKPQAARQAFRLALLLSVMCWLGAKCVPT